MLRSVARFLLGHWRAALADATEAAALAAETSQPVWAAAAIAVQAILAGAGGDESRAYALATEAEHQRQDRSAAQEGQQIGVEGVLVGGGVGQAVRSARVDLEGGVLDELG